MTKCYDSMSKTANLFDSLWILDDLYGTSWSRPRIDRHDPSFRSNVTEEGLVLSIDLPGVKKTDLTVQVKGNQLDVSGKLREKDFKYSYRINRIYKPEPREATLEDGVLTMKFETISEARTINVLIK